MKKLLKWGVGLFFLVLGIWIISDLLLTERVTEYEIGNYSVVEKLRINQKEKSYDFIVTNKDKDTFIFDIIETSSRKKKIIKDIKSYKENNLKCIYPIYKNKFVTDVRCLYDGKQVSYSYLKQINNKDIDKIIEKVKKDGFNNPKWSEKDEKAEWVGTGSRKIKVYQESLIDDYSFLVWRYKGLYVLNSKEMEVYDFLDNDQYDNVYSYLVSNYYVVAVIDSDSGRIEKIVCFDVEKRETKTIKFKEKTSIKYYFNGVIEDKLYVTDVGSKKQYIIDPKKGKIEVLEAAKEQFISYKNGQKIAVEPNILLEEEVYFGLKVELEELNKIYDDIVEVKEILEYYYFRTENAIYRVNKNNLEKAELLFSFDDISEWVVVGKDMLVVVSDKVYFYNDEVGLSLILENSELKYNYKNICTFWKA